MVKYGLALVALAAGCADEAGKSEEPVARVDLRQAMTAAEVAPVGVAVDAAGQHFVFDRDRGLYRITDGVAVEVVGMAAMPEPEIPIRLPITDLVATKPGVFALTAIGDGFLLDVNAMTLKQHFCYEPGGLPDDQMQRTGAIAYDAKLDKLYAQPITFDETGAFVASQVASYSATTGAQVQWYDVASTVDATAMAVVPDVGVVLGQGARLDRFDPVTGALEQHADLGRFGVQSIDGLAVDSARGVLVVVDDTRDELIEIDLAQL